MKNATLLLAAVLLTLPVLDSLSRVRADDRGAPTAPACAPDCEIVTEVCYTEVTRKVCRIVPDVKKVTKTIYCCKQEDYCAPRCTLPCLKRGCDGCDTCADCGVVRTKNYLIRKTIVVDCPTTKCVVETTVDRIPYTVHHRVPCSPRFGHGH